jgi:AcrR family transcriptional regulator
LTVGYAAPMGLRELKKQQTRQLIADTAWRLFADRGFDRVTVAEVAHEAQVAEATVFNYFPTKEDLFYHRLETFEAGLVEAVAAREPGEPALAAIRRYLLASDGLLTAAAAGDTDAWQRLRTVNRVIADSRALQAREQQTLARSTNRLAELLAADTGAAADDVTARAAANALLGVQRALVDHVRRRVLADDDPARLATDARDLGERAFALLERGLGDYAAKPPA